MRSFITGVRFGAWIDHVKSSDAKTCTVCGTTKPLAAFAKSNRARGGLHTFCRACKAAQSRAWYRKTPERQKARNRRRYLAHGAEMRRAAAEWYTRNKAHANDLQRRWRLRKDFGITLEEYDAWVAMQGGRCGVCQQLPRTGHTRRRALHVDHCHATHTIRGLLCHHCNVGMGHFLDDPTLLRAAADYLERSRKAKSA